MDASLLNILKDWQFFFSTVAAATATLTGLLFVALSINVKHFRKQKHVDAMQTARGAFGDFLYVLMIGIVFLVPLKAAFGFAIALIALGVSRLVGVIRLLIQPLRQNRYKHTLASSIREFALPLVATVGLISVGIAIWLGYYNSIFYLVIVIAAQLTTASWKAWHLLLNEKREDRKKAK